MRVPAAIATAPFATIHPPNTAGQRGINTQLDFGLQSISAFAKVRIALGRDNSLFVFLFTNYKSPRIKKLPVF